MQHVHARHVVLGAGAMGSSAAYQLARRGEPVTLVEQFSPGHDRGSSHGAARITRHSYADARYARLMPEAFRAWRLLEADAGQNLYLRTGGVSLCPPGDDYVARVAASLDEIGVPFRRMTGARLRKDLPVFQVPDDTDALFEPDAGILAAARIVRAQVELAREFGGEKTVVLFNHPVLRIDLDADRPTLVTAAGTITADRLIVTAGPWTQRLFPDWPVPLRTTRQQVVYFRPRVPERFAPGRFPIFIVNGATEHDDFYGMPAFDGFGVKVAKHGREEINPDQPDPTVGDAYHHSIRESLRACLPELASAPIDHTEVCLYNVAPGEQFQLTLLPERTDIAVASPCSGHGFKFSALIGRVLADLVTIGSTDVPVAFWEPART